MWDLLELRLSIVDYGRLQQAGFLEMDNTLQLQPGVPEEDQEIQRAILVALLGAPEQAFGQNEGQLSVCSLQFAEGLVV